MRKRLRHQSFLSAVAAGLSHAWRKVRLRWRTANKLGGFVAVFVAAFVSVFAFLLHALYLNKVDQQNLACLALNVYFEARGEPTVGQYAVAEVTMNRVRSPRYPKTVCGVVYQKNWDPIRQRYVSAFSWTEFETRPEPKGEEWERARRVAEEVYYRRNTPMLAGVTNYHADYIKPSWSRERTPVARIGNHVFYR